MYRYMYIYIYLYIYIHFHVERERDRDRERARERAGGRDRDRRTDIEGRRGVRRRVAPPVIATRRSARSVSLSLSLFLALSLVCTISPSLDPCCSLFMRRRGSMRSRAPSLPRQLYLFTEGTAFFFEGHLHERRGQNLAMTVLCAPNSLGSGRVRANSRDRELERSFQIFGQLQFHTGPIELECEFPDA